MKTTTRGGARKGAGAPKKEPTKVITTRVRLTEEKPVRTAIKATIAKLRATAVILAFPFMASAQLIPSAGFGLSATHYNTHIRGEVGARVGSFGYAAVSATGNHQGYNPLTIAPQIGTAWSWNNRKGHELTTMFFVKYDFNTIKTKKTVPGFGAVGFRHYVYRMYSEVTYNQYGRVDLTLGWSFGDIYR